jgi:hypothetical protein
MRISKSLEEQGWFLTSFAGRLKTGSLSTKDLLLQVGYLCLEK